MIFAVESAQSDTFASALAANDFAVTRHDQPLIAAELLRRERPDLIAIVEAGSAGVSSFPHLRELARQLQIASIAIAGPAAAATEWVASHDDWVSEGADPREMLIRVRRLIDRPSAVQPPAIDPRFLALVIHDLRTPLNVINLTIRAIGQSVPTPSDDFQEDLTFLSENSKQIERMLAQLGDYCRLVEAEQQHAAFGFETKRFLTDFLDEKQSRRDPEFKSVRLEIAGDAPSEVALDPNRVRLAIQHGLANAVAAAGDAPVRLRSRGPSGRWTIEITVEKAPPPTINSTPLQSHIFERLIGSAQERRGLDLAIAARVSELFGGQARLEVEPGKRSSILLEWPTGSTP